MATEIGFRSIVLGSSLDAVNEDNPLPVALPPGQGYSVFSVIAGSSNNSTIVKSGLTYLLGWALYNHAVAERLVRIYDIGEPTAPAPATDFPRIKLRLGIPATATGAGQNIMLPQTDTLIGLRLDNGLSFTITTTVTSDTDNTSVTAGDVLVNLFYL